MPRDGSGVYTSPSGTHGVPNTTISSTAYNTNVDDVALDLNTPRPVVAGGTGAADAPTALKNLGAEAAAFPSGCGRLVWVDATHIKFIPFNGDRIKVNGVNYLIPAAGVTIPNTGVNVGGVTTSLAASTVYLVGLGVTGTTLTPFFYANATSHAPSTAAGNIGIEVIGGNDSYSLIGMVRTNVGGGFTDSDAQRWVTSWFNPPARRLLGVIIPSAATSSNAPFDFGSTYWVEWVAFTNRPGLISFIGNAYTDTAQFRCTSTIGVDGVLTGTTVNADTPAFANGYGGSFSVSAVTATFADGYHYAQCVGSVNGGHVGTWAAGLRGVV